MTALLSATNLGLIRGERRLFRCLNFALNAGEALHVAGANGVGKTSLLRLVAGLLAPDSGELRWQGRRIDAAVHDYRNDLVWLGHKTGCKQDLSAFDNLHFERALRPSSACTPDAALERLQIAPYADLPLRALSAGQQRRVALARLLLSRARLWLLDEPYTNLDEEGRSLVDTLIDEHLAAGGACMAASHQALAIRRPHQRLALE